MTNFFGLSQAASEYKCFCLVIDQSISRMTDSKGPSSGTKGGRALSSPWPPRFLPKHRWLSLEKAEKPVTHEEAARSSSSSAAAAEQQRPGEEKKAAAVELPKEAKKDSRRCVFFTRNTQEGN